MDEIILLKQADDIEIRSLVANELSKDTLNALFEGFTHHGANPFSVAFLKKFIVFPLGVSWRFSCHRHIKGCWH